jgi:hypothetical protein
MYRIAVSCEQKNALNFKKDIPIIPIYWCSPLKIYVILKSV